MKSKELKLHGYGYKSGGVVSSEQSEPKKAEEMKYGGKAMGKVSGEDTGSRLDKYKRGGKVKGKARRGDTKITIVNAPMAKDRSTPTPVPVPVPAGIAGAQVPQRVPVPPVVGPNPMIRKCGGRTR